MKQLTAKSSLTTMQLLLKFALVVFVAIAETALGNDDCTALYFTDEGCCNSCGIFPRFNLDPIISCGGRTSLWKPSHTSPKMKRDFACLGECLFYEQGLLNKDNQLDKAAITKFFVASKYVLKPTYDDIEKCFSSHVINENTSLNCTSGAFELGSCLNRELFLNCPSSLWSATPMCNELKANVTKCPKTYVLMTTIE